MGLVASSGIRLSQGIVEVEVELGNIIFLKSVERIFSDYLSINF